MQPFLDPWRGTPRQLMQLLARHLVSFLRSGPDILDASRGSRGIFGSARQTKRSRVVVGGVVARPHTSSRRILSVIAADLTFLRKTQRRKDSENHFLKLSRPRFPAV